MRTALLASLAVAVMTSTASAQVSTDSQSLDKLSPTTPAPAASAAPAKPAMHHPRRTTPPARRSLPAVAMPAAPPANPVIQPPAFVMPAHKPPPPPPVPALPAAAGAATPIEGGARITFGAGVADLNPTTFAAIKAIAAQAVAAPATTISVLAWAPGPADDPSTARRLSLDRALAVRAVLISNGVLSDRIRAVAKGSADVGQGTADRADVVLGK